jgi:tetratricopeptide (TPR) repeat protein
LIFQEQGDDVTAVHHFKRALELLPSFTDVHVALGRSYLTLKDYPRAQIELELAVKLSPNDIQANYQLAVLYARLKDSQRAQQQMQIVERLKAATATPNKRLRNSPIPMEISLCNLCVLCVSVVCSAQNSSTTEHREHRVLPVTFEDVTQKSGITWVHNNAQSAARHLPETVGPGCAFFDYDNDGWLDIFFVNSGSSDFFTPDKPLRNALYRNNHDGTFTDVTVKPGLKRRQFSAWA